MITQPFVEHTQADLSQWAQAHFSGAVLGHVLRTRRLVTIAEAYASRPGCSIPRLFDRPADIKAAYTFFEHPRCNPDSIQQAHRSSVRQAAGSGDLVLFIEDTTEISFSHRKQHVEGLGSVAEGKAHHQGFFLHSVLSVGCPGGDVLDARGGRLPLHVLGLADQQSYVRPAPIKKAKRAPNVSKSRAGEDRETQRWERSVERIGPAPSGTRWERIADREADIYENLSESQRFGYGFTIRARHSRCLVDALGGEKLFDRIRASQRLGTTEVALRSRPGQAARTAAVSIAGCQVLIRAPQRPDGGPGKLAPIACSVVRAWEDDPPAGVEALEWILLCDGEIGGYEEARERVARYATRWLIEEFHKGLKTGLGAERLQLEQGESIMAAVAVMSVVALRLVDLREQVRLHADRPAHESGLTALEIEILRVRLKRAITTVGDVGLAVGRLGGHLNRTGDGMPGWITLWRGMQELRLLVEGVRLARLLPDER